MVNGQKFKAVSRYSGRIARKFTLARKGIYTVMTVKHDHIICQERTSNGLPIMIFFRVFWIQVKI